MIKSAIQYMENTSEIEVSQVFLLNFIASKHNVSKESVRGSIIGFSPHKLMGQSGFLNKWDVVPRSKGKAKRFVKKGENSNVVTMPHGLSYLTEEKQRARCKVFSLMERRTRPNILTMAGHDGGCVNYFLSKRPKSKIVTVEKLEDVYKDYKKLKFNTEDHNMTIGDYLRDTDKRFNLINYDAVYGLCGYIANDLGYINRNNLSDVVALTLQNIKRFRNHGKWVDKAREDYYKYEDPTLTCVKDILYNYKMVEEFVYVRDKSVGSRAMRLLIFKKI